MHFLCMCKVCVWEGMCVCMSKRLRVYLCVFVSVDSIYAGASLFTVFVCVGEPVHVLAFVCEFL